MTKLTPGQIVLLFSILYLIFTIVGVISIAMMGSPTKKQRKQLDKDIRNWNA